jgi:hypothetical protein
MLRNKFISNLCLYIKSSLIRLDSNSSLYPFENITIAVYAFMALGCSKASSKLLWNRDQSKMDRCVVHGSEGTHVSPRPNHRGNGCSSDVILSSTHGMVLDGPRCDASQCSSAGPNMAGTAEGLGSGCAHRSNNPRVPQFNSLKTALILVLILAMCNPCSMK